MASGDLLFEVTPLNRIGVDWQRVAFTSGSSEPTADGDGTAVIWGDTSDANARLEYLSLESGTWGGGDAAGWMLLSNWNGTAWSSGENFTADTTTPGNHGTLTSVPVNCSATPDTRNGKPVLDFDDTVNEISIFQISMAPHYDGGGLTVTCEVAATSATTGDFSCFVFLMSVTPDADDLDVKNFAAPNENTAIDVATAAGETVTFTITFTDGADMDSLAAGELGYLLFMRDAQDSTNDDASGDMELVRIKGTET